MIINTLPLELIEKILLFTDLNTVIATGNKYYIEKMYNKNSWIWAAQNNKLDTIIWLHFNKKSDFDKKIINILDKNNYLKIKKFIDKYYNYFGKKITTQISRNGNLIDLNFGRDMNGL